MSEVGVDVDALPLPRRVAIAELLRDILATERELAELYAAFAARSTLEPLKAALLDLAQAKTAHVAAIEPVARVFARVLSPNGTPGAARGPDAETRWRGEEFARAFRGERVLEVAYRELAALLDAPDVTARLAALAADTARGQARLRQLYLQYS